MSNIFFINSICFLLLDNASGQNKKMEGKEISIMWDIGMRNGVVVFRDNNSNDLIAFDDGFKLYKHSPIDYRPMFINDKCEVFAMENNNGILIFKNGHEEKIMLPGYPERLVASQNGDTLYYSCWNCYPNKLNENIPIQIFIIAENKLIEGINVHYENFWYTENGIAFIRKEEISDTVQKELMDIKSSLFINKNVQKDSENILLDSGTYNFGIISNDGNYWTRQSEKNIIIKTSLCNKEKWVENMPYFFYKNRPVVLKSYNFFIGADNFDIIDFNIKDLCEN